MRHVIIGNGPAGVVAAETIRKHRPNDEIVLIGERIWNMERDFNNKAGFTRKDDDLPPRLKTEGAKTGPAKGLVSGIDKMVPEYYQIRGWDTEGRLTADTRKRLGL